MTVTVLLTGAAGMLGSALLPILRQEGYEVYPTDVDCNQAGVSFLDIRDENEVLSTIRRLKPNFVIHLAAKTDVERCESEPEDAYSVNVLGTINVAQACKSVDATMVYISTAGVFDGKKKEPYTELDEPNPLNVYGRTKLEGERIVASLRKSFIIRTSWLFGGGMSKDKKFVGKIMRQLIQGSKVLYAVTDKLGTPTYTVDLSRCISNLIKTHHYGLYHVACKGHATRFDVAKEILTWSGRDDIKLIPVTSDHFSKEYYAPRPASEMLENYMLESIGMNTPRYWREALREYLNISFGSFMKRG